MWEARPRGDALRFRLLLRFHIPAQQLVDSGLVALTLGPEPFKNICINTNGHGLFARKSPGCIFEKRLIKLWHFAGVDLFIRHGLQTFPIST